MQSYSIFLVLLVFLPFNNFFSERNNVQSEKYIRNVMLAVRFHGVASSQQYAVAQRQRRRQWIVCLACFRAARATLGAQAFTENVDAQTACQLLCSCVDAAQQSNSSQDGIEIMHAEKLPTVTKQVFSKTFNQIIRRRNYEKMSIMQSVVLWSFQSIP